MYSDLRPFKDPLCHSKVLDNLAAVLDEVDRHPQSHDVSDVDFEGAIPLKNYHKVVKVLRKEFRVPLAKETIPEDLNLFSIFNVPNFDPDPTIFLDRYDSFSKESKTVAHRCFVAGISRYYNNLLMGIQGNLSLISIGFGGSHSHLPIIKNAEELVQSGSFAISLLLGYLAERREQRRRLRYDHLIAEVATLQSGIPQEKDRQHFEQWISDVSKFDGLAHIAEKCANSFNRLLKSIATWVEWIHLSKGLSAEISDRLLKVMALAEAGYSISSKLLAFSSKNDFNLQKTVLQEILDVSVDQFKAQYPTIHMNVRQRQPGIDLLTDRDNLHRILNELLQNAADSMAKGGDLTLSVKKLTLTRRHSKWSFVRAGEYVKIKVKDSGTGLNSDLKTRVFDPFFTTKSSSKRLGLGLSMVYGVAKQLGGVVTIDSEPGQGTSVKLLLPRYVSNCL